MSERDVVLANYMLASIQKDLVFLRDNRFLNDKTYNDIVALLPSRVQSAAPAPAALSPAPAVTTSTSTTHKPPLPTRKSAGVSPRLAPAAAPRENSIPKLPARRSNNVSSQETPKPAPRSQPVPAPVVHVLPPKQAAAAPQPPPPPPPAYTPEPEPLATAEALYDYNGDDPSTDLSFRQGDIIKVTEYGNINPPSKV